MPSFLKDYTQIITDAIPVYYTDNYDADRFGLLPFNWCSLPKKAIGRCLAQSGFVMAGRAKRTVQSGIQFVEPHLSGLEWLYSHLADEESREILTKVFAYRALGQRKIKLPLNSHEHWERVRTLKKMAEGSETIPSGFMHFKLARLNLRELGYPIEMFYEPAAVVTTFIEQQYRCLTPDGVVECAKGDVAIDAGGCWGDTALYFAHKVGERGKVASFEFLPDNITFFEKNLNLNPELASRIRLYKNPVWSSSGEELYVSGHGPGTSVGPIAKDANDLKVQTLSIDKLVQRGDLEKVDFIKMDIEGSELAALHGCERTIRQYKPKLAITVYHNLEDFWTIPQYLNQLGLNYSFYLRHFSIHAEETVLFAKV